MNDILYDFPLLDPPEVDPPDVDPPELLEDEQPAASASAMAAAPAVGATKDRFIPAPSYVMTWAGCRCRMTPGAGRWGVLCLALRFLSTGPVQRLAISRKHVCSILHPHVIGVKDVLGNFFLGLT